MTTIGRVPEFDPSKEDFESYLERFERWLDANEIVDGKKANVFLSVLGPTEYRLLKSLVEPRKCVELTYTELTEAMSTHFKPKPILIAERFRFYRRVQNTGEPLADFIIDLKKLASSCEFGQFLDDALRDRFVVGLAEEAYHRRLLTEKDLTFKKACDIALGLELAHKDTKELSGTQNVRRFTRYRTPNLRNSHQRLSLAMKETSRQSTRRTSQGNLATGVAGILTTKVTVDSSMRSAIPVERQDMYRGCVEEQNAQEKLTMCRRKRRTVS